MGLLARIETSFCILEISGPTEPRSGFLRGNHSKSPEFRVECLTEDAEAIDVYPYFFEETDYRVQAQSKIAGEDVTLWHRDRRLIKDIEKVTRASPPTITGRLRFRQSVGLSTFVVTVGENSMSATIEVFPIKLDYETDYREMVADVRSVDRLLALQYFEDTYRGATLEDVSDQHSLDWLSILRSLISDLEKSLIYAAEHPLDSLTTTIDHVRADRIRRPDSATRNAMFRGQGQGPLFHVQGIGAIHTDLPSPRIVDTYDSSEHRWLYRQLRNVLQELNRLEDELVKTVEGMSQRAQVKTTARINQEIAEIGVFIEVTTSLLRLSIFRDVSELALPANFSSIRLLSTSGYSQVYQALMSLRMGLESLEGGVEVSIDRLGKLYEIWCFTEVLKQLSKAGNVIAVDHMGHFMKDGTLGRTLVKGQRVQLSFALPDGRKIEVRYNSSYPGLTGTQYPDIVISFIKETWPEIIVLLDAKYQLNLDEEAKKQFGIVPPPQDAIDALHRYRDAVVIADPRSPIYVLKDPWAKVRPVVKGAALYPLPSAESENYSESRLARAMETLGIGGIPFLPGNTEIFEQWLTRLLAKPHNDLAQHGPNFVGELYN